MNSGKRGEAGILVVGHGSRRVEANDSFIALVGRVASRLGGAKVLPTFFSIAKPGIEERVAALAAGGGRRIVLMPYLLYSGQHVARDIPALLAECRRNYPGLRIEVLPALEDEPALEDVLVERLARFAFSGLPRPPSGSAIQRQSFKIIDGGLKELAASDSAAAAIVRQVVHATGDFSFARTMRISPGAVGRGVAALTAGRPIVCDVKMLAAGITHSAGQVLCAVEDADATGAAQASGATRSAAAMEKLVSRLNGAILAVGNGPTALWQAMRIAQRGNRRPALVVGLPVGLVGAAEAKAALWDSGLCCITNVGPRGGSAAAAAVVNALALLASGAGTVPRGGRPARAACAGGRRR